MALAISAKPSPKKSIVVQREVKSSPVWSPSQNFIVRFVSGKNWIEASVKLSAAAASVTGASSCGTGTGTAPADSAAQSASAQTVFFFMHILLHPLSPWKNA